MFTLTRYISTIQKSVRVDVTPSITQNPKHHEDNHEIKIAVDIKYKNYINGVFDACLTFMLPLEEGITYENIYEGYFRDFVEEKLDELNVEIFARETVTEAIARSYLGMKETRVVVESASSCLLSMSVIVEVDEYFEEVHGLAIDLDQYYNHNHNDSDSDIDDDNYDGNIDNNVGVVKDVKEIRAFLEKCGVSFSRASMSGSHCTICLETMGSGGETELARLPCNHVFHGDCVVEMMAKGDVIHACPLCRAELIVVQTK